MEELEVIIQRMMDAGESERSIMEVVQAYEAEPESQPDFTDDREEEVVEVKEEPTQLDATVEGGDTDSGSGSVQDRTVQPNIVIPEVIGDAPDLTMEDITMTDEERTEFDRKAKEQRQKGIEGQKLYLREKQIQDKTGLLPSNYPNLQVGTEIVEKRVGVGPKDYTTVSTEEPVYEQVDLEKMEEITAGVTSEYRNAFNSLMSDELETLQNYAEDPMTYENELNETHDQVFAVMQEKYPGLDKRAFMDIVGKGGDGLFQTALNKVTAEDKEKDNAENLLGATTLDEDVYKQIFNQTSKNFSEKELKKQGLNTLIRKKNRDLIRLQEEGGDAKEIKRLTSEIKTHQNDIQKLATIKGTGLSGEYGEMFGPSRDTKDKKLASSYMDNETTEYRQGKIDKAKKDLDGTLLTQVQEQKIKNPKLTDFEAHELLYKSKAYNLQQLWTTGNTETANLKFNKSRNPQLYNKLKEVGVDVGEGLNINVDVPLKKLFDIGYDGRDFDGLSGVLNDIDISEKDRKQLLNYESAIYRNKGELELLHELTYVNNDPATFDRGGFIGEVARAGLSATLTHFTDINPIEADKLASLGPGATESKMLEEFEKLGSTYNETFKNEIAKGEIDELGFTPDQLKAIERTLGEEVGEGFGHFVPMLIELGVISAATGATMTATGAARVLAGMKNAGGWKKTQYHAIMTMIEEGKMFTAGFDPGAGAGFYAGGQLTSGVTPFKKRFKWMDPFFQKVVKGGPVGAASAQIAFNLETGIQDLLGNKDFQATFDKHYGDLEFKDILVEAMVFKIAGATHVKKTDFMSTRRKYDAMTELKDKMKELIDKPTGQLGKEGVGRALETAFTTGPDGKIVRTRPEGYEMMSREQQAKWEALNEAHKTLDQMTKVETTAIDLDPTNKDFKSNVQKRYMDPVNETIKSVHKDFEGFKIEWTENPKDPRLAGNAEAKYIESKAGKAGTIVFLKSKFTAEKLMHEIGHTGMESYFKRNPEAEVQFTQNMAKLFEKFDFSAYDGTPLGEFIRDAYGKSAGGKDMRTKAGKSEANREFLAYMFELLTDPKIYYQKVAPTFFKEAKQEMLSIMEESIGIKPKIRNVGDFVKFIGRLSIDARRGLGFQAKMARLADLEEFDFLGIQFVENQRKNLDKAVEQGYSSKNLNRQKEVFLDNKKESEVLVDGKKQETLLYTIDKHLFDAEGNRKYKNATRLQRSQDFVDVYEKILKPNGVLDTKIKEGMTDVIPPEGMGAFINKVKDQLQIRLIKNFKPEKGGGSLAGYMTEIAIPKEKARVKENYLKDKATGKEGTISLDKMSEEGSRLDIEAPTSNLLEKLETEIIIPSKEKLEKKEGPQQYVDMIKDSFKTEKEKERYDKDIDKAVVEADINIDVEKPTYKDIKKEVVSVEKITKKDKEGNIIIDNKTGKPKLFTPTKEADATPAGRLPKVLEVVADKYGIPLKRMLANQTLNDKMRTKARNRILQTINNWKKSLPDGETISGTATGIANTSWAFLYNFPGGRGSFAEGKTAAGKAPVTRRKDITTQEILDAVGIDVNGNFLPGTKYDSAIKEYIKLETQWTAVQSMMKTGKGRFTQAALAEVGSGRNEALASKMIKEFSEAFDIPLEKTQDILLNYAIGNKLLVEKKYRDFLDRFKDHEFFSDPRQAALWSAVEVEGLKGKTTATKFMGDFNTYWDNFKGELPDGITVKDIKALKPKAFYTESKGNVVVEVERLNKHVDLSVEFSKMLPKGFEKSLTFFKEAIGLHQRVTQDKEGRYAKFADKYKKGDELGEFTGFIMDSRDGSPIINQPFVLARERALENLGKNVSNLWKGIDIKFKSASTQEAGQRAIAKAKTFEEQLKIAEKYFTELDNKTKEDIYFALEATKQEFIEAGKNKQEKLDRMEWMYNVARSNTNLRMGVRQTVPVKYVLFPEGPITEGKIKLEHLKAMVTQSIQTANLVASGTFKKAGKEATSDFLGITSTKDLLDIVDNLGGTTNTSGLYRMSLLHPEILSQYKSVESGFKRTLLQDIQIKFEKEVGSKKFKELQKQHKLIDKNLTKQLAEIGFASKDLTRGEKERRAKIVDNAIKLGRDKKKKARGMSTFDFDETVGISENYVIATKGKEKKRIASAEWPFVGEKLINEGWKMDFTDFNKVTKGKPGPLMQKMKNQIEKFGNENVFILTARAKESAQAIHEWLKSEGVNIPLKNITGLGNSTGEAKAMWMLEKFSEGYNDMYFVDDALPNVKAVKNVLEQLDIKSKVQQALASKDLGKEVNDIMEHSFGIESKKVFSTAEGKVRGKDKKRRKFFMTDSASDLDLLLEPLYGKGKKGIENKKWFEKNFHKPWERGVNDLNTARQTILNDYMSLRKNNKDVVKSLSERVEGTNFTADQAARVYIWNKAGFEAPGLTKTSKTKLLEHVANNPKLQAYAESVAKLTKIETGLKQPKETWWAETIASEVSETGRTVGRSKYISEWIEKKNEIFTKENIAKMESELGPKWREALENMFYRMETGTTRTRDLGRLGNEVMNYLNGSVGAIMNLNTRSATLQLISTVNFINHAENNPLAAAKAFANQPQYWKDFMRIMNSDMLKQRRDGLKINVTEAELAAAVDGKGSKAKRAIAYILKQGYIPTKIADSFAISSGGATYYRNRAKMYQKQGLSLKEAEAKAFLDFQAIAERTQQSSRPDLLSQQQTSFEGRLLLPFANTPMQMNRIMMKEMLDLSKGRYEGAFGENSFTNKASKVAYYGFVQSAIFAGLQTGLFALMANSDDDKVIAEKKVRAYNTVADSFLRGMGIPGVVASGVKNAGLAFAKQNEKGFGADYSEVGEALLNMSPTIGSKFSKLDAAGNTYAYNKKEILEKGLSLDNTKAIEAAATTIEALTNIPIARVIRKTENIQGALDTRNEGWQRGMMALGWSGWDIQSNVMKIEKAEKVEERKVAAKKRAEVKKAEKKIKVKEENKVKIEENKKKQEQEKRENKEVKCAAISKSGKRCGSKIVSGKSFCTVHEKAAQRKDGKKTQCRKRKKDGKRCGMKTSSKSGFCYYHD